MILCSQAMVEAIAYISNPDYQEYCQVCMLHIILIEQWRLNIYEVVGRLEPAVE